MTLNNETAAAGPDAYQRLLDIAALADAEEGIRQDLEDVKQGRTRPIREFFDEFEAKNAISSKH